MDHITVAMVFSRQRFFPRLLDVFADLPEVKKIIVISPGGKAPLPSGCDSLAGEAITSGDTLNRLFAAADTPYLLFSYGEREIQPGPRCLSRFLDVAKTTQSGMVYSDYFEINGGEQREHPLNDYQLGSIRDDFDFGLLTLFSLSAVQEALSRFGPLANCAHAGFYDLRLRLSLRYPLFHVREYLYTALELKETQNELTQFTYVDPHYYAIQKEMEGVATEHLQRMDAYLEPVFAETPPSRDAFPVEASVVIPVRNRRHTIACAVQSALSQNTDFPFNVIVVDNHSDDGTTALLAGLSQNHPGMRHVIPTRRDLNIGGCWNEAVFSAACGRYAVQLDSDDLYSSPHTLQKIVDLLGGGNYAMVIGSYTLVNYRQDVIPPGLIDHREWTEENGRNNALRINGLGAPRAFHVGVLRKIGFLNIGYGEDYAVTLRISREYRIGRIYENLYLCRRWEGNSDASLTVVQKNRYDSFKDNIRTIEIMARREMNRERNYSGSQFPGSPFKARG